MAWLRRNQILIFFALTLALTWALWIPAVQVKLAGGETAFGPDSAVGGLARWAPGIVATLLALLLGGKEGLRQLFRPLRLWRVHVGWYAFALFFNVAVFFAARLVDGVLGRSYEVVSPLVAVYGAQAAMMVPFIILFALPGSFAEELGWRGFAQPRLQERRGALVASLIIGLVWGLWHIPTMIYFGELGASDYPGWLWPVLNMLPTAVLYGWLYNNTRGSLLLVTLFHVGQQLANNLLGLWPGYTDDVIVWIVAVIVAVAGAAGQDKRVD